MHATRSSATTQRVGTIFLPQSDGNDLYRTTKPNHFRLVGRNEPLAEVAMNDEQVLTLPNYL